MFKVPHQVYTAEFKEAAVQRVKDGQGLSAVSRELGMSTQTLRHWLKASEAGKLNGPGAKVITAEQMELSRLRAENKRLQMELEIAKKAAARSTGRCNTFWSNVGPGGKVGESRTKMRAIACTNDVVVAEMERW
ncbi:transposase [Paraburkholderia bannensis]|uniref:Transposase n=1 Tax=Paraburkholderia bannensis TaxID=765414 RepID=A0A7W9WV95_9BURK|nr:transposase [Paraburkholderia sp. WP4_3_2]MBB6105132.1 transposase [Paraburkholderia bannensis]